MSTIPKGLRADYMRERMEDKATITVAGGIYVGKKQITLRGAMGEAINAYETECLLPGSAGLPLVSNGSSAEWPYLSYQELGSKGVANGAITKAKLGAGTVVSLDNNKKIFDAYMDGDILVIVYRNAS